MDFYAEYNNKLRTPDQAVQAVKSGDWIDYGTNVCFPTLLDAALAKRRDELYDVKIRGNLCFGPIMTVECDPMREHFCYNSWHCSSYERQLCDKGLCSYIPMIFRNLEPYYRHFLTVNVAMMCVTPMDRHGFFNLSCGAGIAQGIIEKADIVILEVNEHLPRILGGFDESVHISDVDFIVEGEHPPLPEFPIPEAAPEEIEIANILVPFIEDGSTLQLGIGSMPNVVGSILAQSDVRDLGMHTELCGDAYYELYKAGKLTNKCKTFRPGKGVTGIVFGSKALYDWVDRNPGVIIEPLEYRAAGICQRCRDHCQAAQNDFHQQLYFRGPVRTGQRRERGTPPHQRDRRPAGLSDRGGHGPRRKSLYLHDLFAHGQKRRPHLPHSASF